MLVHWLRRRLRRVLAPFRGATLRRELDEEFRLHIELETEERVQSGMTQVEARRTALRDFGGLDRFGEEARALRGALWLDHLTRDVRHGVRALLRAPGFSAVAILTLALGIGANTAMFSVVNGVLLRPLPYDRPEQVVLVWRSSPERGLDELPVAHTDYREWRAATRQLSDLAVWKRTSVTLLTGGDPERVISEFASANLFPLLGAAPVLGRVFSEQEEQGKEPVAVISHDLWQRRFAGRTDVLGQPLLLNGDGDAWKRGARTVRVVGVLPAGFYFPDRSVDVWEPAATYWRFDRELGDRNLASWNVVARLQPGASLASASTELRAVAERLEAAMPVANQESATDVRLVPMLDYVTGKDMQYAVWLLLGAVSFVLLIACANVANLLLARGAARAHELATRIALGASRGRVLGQLLAETGVLVGIAVLPALLLAALGLRALTVFVPADLPRFDEITLDGRVLAFTILTALVTGLAFGLAPAWKLSRSDPRDALSESKRTAGGLRMGRTRRLLVVSECALAMALLACAGLLIRSLQHIKSQDLGFQPDNVLLMRVAWPPDLPSVQQAEAWGLELIDRIEALPGVRSAASTIGVLRAAEPDAEIALDGRATSDVRVAVDAVGPGFFQTVGTPILRGRDMHWNELSSSAQFDLEQPAVINETLARIFFGDQDPVGQRVRVGPPGNKEWWLTIVGVSGDMRRQSPEQPPVPQIFFGAVSFQVNELLVRTAGQPIELVPAIRQIVHGSASTAIVLSATTLTEHVAAQTAELRFQTWLLALFALLALALAVVGVYGVMHYAVAQRMRELSIRVAMGARAGNVLALVVRQGLGLAAAGVGIGLLAALGLSRAIAHQLFGVGTTDILTYTGVTCLLLGTALLACIIPASRAMRVEPSAVLKAD